MIQVTRCCQVAPLNYFIKKHLFKAASSRSKFRCRKRWFGKIERYVHCKIKVHCEIALLHGVNCSLCDIGGTEMPESAQVHGVEGNMRSSKRVRLMNRIKCHVGIVDSKSNAQGARIPPLEILATCDGSWTISLRFLYSIIIVMFLYMHLAWYLSFVLSPWHLSPINPDISPLRQSVCAHCTPPRYRQLVGRSLESFNYQKKHSGY